MSTHQTESALEGRTVLTSDGEKLGKIDSVLVDDSGRPQYAEVKSGWFASRRHTVPVSGLSPDGDDLKAAYTKEQLEKAPTFDEGEEINYDRERTIGSHYGTDVREWDDSRDAWLAGEDLSRGPTPETRHPDGGVDDVSDTTQGPTPETRQAMRLSDDDTAAAGQPSSDERTRGDVGGNQDEDVALADREASGDTGRDVPGRNAEGTTRSGEEMRTGTTSSEASRVRLRKRIDAGRDI